MKVTAIANESIKDIFGISLKVGDEIHGEAAKYSQSHIWVKYGIKGLDDEDLLSVQIKIKVVEGSITKEKPLPYNEMGGMNRKKTSGEDVESAAKEIKTELWQ